ncbi:Endo-1,4-beta-xylanase [Bertholletia excelsa]
MGRPWACCFVGRVYEGHREPNPSQRTGEKMESPSTSNADPFHSGGSNGNMDSLKDGDTANVIMNHDFSKGLDSWHANCCDAFVVSPQSGHREGLASKSSGNYAVISNRKECWQGLEQDITGRIFSGSNYTVLASVGVSGPIQGLANVQATLKLEYRDSAASYLFIGRTSVSKEQWAKVEGTFSLSALPERVVFYLEGPSPGVDLLIESVVISCPNTSTSDSMGRECIADGNENIILNPSFEDGLKNWSARGCKIVLHDSMGGGKVLPQSGKFFAAATERTQTWNGIQQEITGRVQRKLAYEVIAVVRIFGNNVSTADVRATLWVQTPDFREQYISIANVQATDKEWVQLQGKFLLNGNPSRVIIYLEGPPAGIDILLNSLIVKHAEKFPPSPPPPIENAAFGVNIITNSSLSDGTNGWFPLGNCKISVGTGSPHILPPMARDSLGPHDSLSGRYILVTNRSQIWMGPAQIITDKVELYLTYQVSAWVRLGYGAAGPQNVNIALSVDGQWVNGGQVEINDDRWHEIGGSFRIEKKPDRVMVYVQGPAPGIDMLIAGLHIFPVDRQARFRYLEIQTDQLRKRDVILKLSGSDCSLFGTFVKVRQVQNSFPIGSCVNRTNIDNEEFADFFTKNFNWAVFGNELKWYWTEPQRGNFNYRDADELLNFCESHNFETRGHCIFWEVESTVQPWVRALNKNDLMIAVQNRLTGLLTRYKGKFKHYDVNNEMLHGSFYQDHLGKDIRSNMFKIAHQLDPSATLFVNDYHIEDGCDYRSSPEKYIQQILDLQEQGAPVGGIGIQGHIGSPVGPIVCSALDKLGILGLPIWFTELDVSSTNEYVRADDLEVMLREAFAHPAVEGIMLWGFWELFMSRDNAHLVDAEGEINEAGRRYLALKEEWLSHCHGHVDEQGHFEFRGFQGTYEVEIVAFSKKVSKTFVVEKGDSPLVVSIDL